MGGSVWRYDVPFERDIRVALRALRDRVFRAGQYLAPTGARKPTSIEDLLEMSGEIGTHSILDIVDVAPQPRAGFVSPLSDAELIDAFGSERPARADVERALARIDAITLQRGRWTGSYVVLYDRDLPSEILFFGYSGD